MTVDVNIYRAYRTREEVYLDSIFESEEYKALEAENAELRRQLAEKDDALRLCEHLFCQSPTPGRCPVCRAGNAGVGFDYCYIKAALEAK